MVDVVQQEVGGDYLPAAIPLRVQFSEKGCRYGIDNARLTNMGVEGSGWERDPIELIPRFNEDLRTRIEIRSTSKRVLSIEKAAKIYAKIAGNLSARSVKIRRCTY